VAQWDYQLGGSYTPPTGTKILIRDRTASPDLSVGYNGCYINGFQTQVFFPIATATDFKYRGITMTASSMDCRPRYFSYCNGNRFQIQGYYNDCYINRFQIQGYYNDCYINRFQTQVLYTGCYINRFQTQVLYTGCYINRFQTQVLQWLLHQRISDPGIFLCCNGNDFKLRGITMTASSMDCRPRYFFPIATATDFKYRGITTAATSTDFRPRYYTLVSTSTDFRPWYYNACYINGIQTMVLQRLLHQWNSDPGITAAAMTTDLRLKYYKTAATTTDLMLKYIL
jgi:hypothetical protein